MTAGVEPYGKPTGNLRYHERVTKPFLGEKRIERILQQELEDMHGCMFWRDVPIERLSPKEVYDFAD